MTDGQTIHRLRLLVKSMRYHIDQGCTDYSDNWPSYCPACKHGVSSRLECKRVTDFDRRIQELGIEVDDD